MLHVSIVENNANEAHSLTQSLLKYQQEKDVSLAVSTYANGLDFLEAYTRETDLVLMDIDMPVLNGIETAEKLREKDQHVLLIFVTNLSQYAMAGYRVQAFDYLLKPIQESLLFMTLDRALRNLPTRDDAVMISHHGSWIKTTYSRIYYVEIKDHQIEYHTADGIYAERETMSRVEQRFHGQGFSRPNNSFLVNLAHVQVVKNNQVMIKGMEISLGRNRKKAFMDDLSRYIGGI